MVILVVVFTVLCAGAPVASVARRPSRHQVRASHSALGPRHPAPVRRPRRRHPRATPPARMLVYTQEWSLWPSRPSLPAGPVGVQVWNRGQDPHDLKIARRLPGGRLGGAVGSAPLAASGEIANARWHLRPGVYELYCSLPGHFAKGMRTRLVVR